ncbi:MAG: hypothetical protein NW200_06100 [Hyphomonadaceae bacterium]|nr:hypothetical protein [Hyphomonadaceae bacterium]
MAARHGVWRAAALALLCLGAAGPGAGPAAAQRAGAEALPEGPVVILAVARADGMDAMAAGRHAPGGPARPRTLRFFFAGPADEARCAVLRRYALPNPDVIDARTGLCAPAGDFAPTPPVEGICYGLPRYPGPGRTISRAETAVRRAREKETLASPPMGPRFIVDPARQPTAAAPARYLYAVSRHQPGHVSPAYLDTLDVFGGGSLPSVTSAGARFGVAAVSSGLAFHREDARLLVVGPVRLRRDGGAWRVTVAEDERPALSAEIARLYGVDPASIAFARTIETMRPMCAPLTQTGDVAARLLSGAR